MVGITSETVDNFVNYLFKMEPFASLLTGTNREGFKNIIIKLLEDLYQNIPEDVIGYLEKNASSKFLDLLYREAGITDYHISKVPEALKVRLSYLLNLLTINRGTQQIFKLFHEALEEFFPKMNIYLIEITPRNLEDDSTMMYKLEPRYITDPDNIIEEVSESDLSGTFLMRPEDFIDREEKFSNIYTDYKSKQRVINVFPVKTGIMYVQNPTGIGNSHFDDYIPLMLTIGATLQKHSMISWRLHTSDTRQLIPFIDFIKLCTYLKYKEFEFKQPHIFKKSSSYIKRVFNAEKGVWESHTINRLPTYTWYTEPLEIYGNNYKLKEWEQANFLAQKDGKHWSNYYTPIVEKLNDFILDDDDLPEAERLEIVYKGLKRSGLYDSRNKLNQFKTDWNTLRQKPANISLRKISNMKEFREELIGTEPISILDFEMILLKSFTSALCGGARDQIFKIKDLYSTNQSNTLDPDLGLVTLVNRFYPNPEFNNFIYGVYGDMNNAEKDEVQLLLDLFKWYIDQGTVPLLKNYWYIKRIKFEYLIDLPYTSSTLNSQAQFDKIYAELTNNDNKAKFTELDNIIKKRYRKIIEQIDALETSSDTTEETFVMIFLNMWKVISAEISSDKRVQFFWNDFFMRFIMGSSFKDFFYDPIMDLFLEYWFPAELTVQNKDIETILIKDKINSIPLDSTWNFTWEKRLMDKHLTKDQFKLTVYNQDLTEKAVYDETFTEIIARDIPLVSVVTQS